MCEEVTNQEDAYIDIEQILYDTRNVYLFGGINNDQAEHICGQLVALDSIDEKPIGLWINSSGGCIGSGWAIIDTILGLKSPVYTFICGEALSMATLIALSGDKRIITEHSVWMFHGMTVGGCDGLTGDQVINRTNLYYDKVQQQAEKYLKKNSKLTNADLKIARKGELWLFPDEVKEKGIVDYVVNYSKRRKK